MLKLLSSKAFLFLYSSSTLFLFYLMYVPGLISKQIIYYGPELNFSNLSLVSGCGDASLWSHLNIFVTPGLTCYDHVMTWYDYDDSYSSWYDHEDYSTIMAWLSWQIAWSCYGGYDHYYNLLRTLIIQKILLLSAQVVIRDVLTRNILTKRSETTQKTFTTMDFFAENSH